jgi:hypothetical protein
MEFFRASFHGTMKSEAENVLHAILPQLKLLGMILIGLLLAHKSKFVAAQALTRLCVAMLPHSYTFDSQSKSKGF